MKIKVGDYAKIIEVIGNDDLELNSICQIIRLNETEHGLEIRECEVEDEDKVPYIYLEGNIATNWYCYDQLEIIPEEVYNSPLFKAIIEDGEK